MKHPDAGVAEAMHKFVHDVINAMRIILSNAALKRMEQTGFTIFNVMPGWAALN